MTPRDLLTDIEAAGIGLAVTDRGTIEVSGDDAAVTEWAPAIREHKAELVDHLRAWAELEAAVSACCAARGDTDEFHNALVADCRREPPTDWPGHLRYFRAEAARWAAVTRPAAPADDRRRCDQCSNLTPAGRCRAAVHGDIAASQHYEPARDFLHRCEGYAPGPADPDRRTGHERWPAVVSSTTNATREVNTHDRNA